MVRMLEFGKGSASIYHLLTETVYLGLKQLVRIGTAVTVLGLRLSVNALHDIHRRFTDLLIGGLGYELDFAETTCIIYKLCHLKIPFNESTAYLLS